MGNRDHIARFLQQAAGYSTEQAQAAAEEIEKQENQRRQRIRQAGEQWEREQEKRRCRT